MDEVYNVVPYKTFDETVGYKIELSTGIRKFSNSSILYYCSNIQILNVKSTNHSMFLGLRALAKSC